MLARIGTSGWVYPHWRSVFYPATLPQRDWFAYYAREFDTVEINNSFYRLPQAETFEAWRSQAPKGFIYSVKASRYITHMKKLKDARQPLKRFFRAASNLGTTFVPTLYQLPPNWRLDLDRFAQFLKALPRAQIHVVEFRDARWFTEEVFQLMERHSIAHCIHDYRDIRVPLRITARQIYLRFHGDPKHGGSYHSSTLKAWARRISEWHSDKHLVFAYFNNDTRGHAIRNALSLKRMLES